MLQTIDQISFAYKSAFLLFIIMGGMISIIVLSQLSNYIIKNDFELLFEKRTKSIIKLETIKDIYIVNIKDTLQDIYHNDISQKQAKEVILLAKQLIKKEWSNYLNIISSKDYHTSFINNFIKKNFIANEQIPNTLLQKRIIENIKRRKNKIDTLLNKIFNQLKNNYKNTSTLLDEINYEIDSITIYLTNLTNYDLNLAIQEKRDTDKEIRILSLILNASIVLVFVFSALLSFLIISNFKKLHFALKGDILEKTEALQRLNKSLELRIKKEVANTKKKELIMFQQARLASMGEMIANIAHQWRQPLGSIMIIVQGLQAKMELGKLSPDILKEKVEDALLLGENMSDTLENFQNFFRPTTAKESFLLKECIEHSFRLSKYILDKHHIQIRIKVSDKIRLHSYYNELSHVFLNIISNAEDALATVSGEKFIEIIAKELKEKIYIYIVDSGGGIKEEILPHIFEPYFTTKYKSSGTGLGLYMSQQIIEKHIGGTIRCKNVCYTIGDKKFKHCTLFTIIIPNKKSEQHVN
ncbi:ATP-binding protein [Sulfurovum indicum]|nr:ATP-binding protein [Sulfurovum indicum]